jgi:uncharacterized protein YggE
MKTTALSAVLAIVVTGAAWSQQTQMYDDRPKITVAGEAVVNVKPDKIVITFGIETSDADVNTAKQKNSELMKKAVGVAKDCGVHEKDIQTDRLSIEPRWEDGYKQQKFLGYFVHNTMMVTLSDLEQMDKLITNALQAGINRLNGVDFQTTEFKTYREQARELALKAAREKAEKMSAVLGQTIGKPLQINENYTGSSWYGGWGRGRSSGMSQVQVQAERGSSGEITDTVALGKLAIRASVSVTFELKK